MTFQAPGTGMNGGICIQIQSTNQQIDSTEKAFVKLGPTVDVAFAIIVCAYSFSEATHTSVRFILVVWWVPGFWFSNVIVVMFDQCEFPFITTRCFQGRARHHHHVDLISGTLVLESSPVQLLVSPFAHCRSFPPSQNM